MPEVERITYISREIASLAKELDITVLCLSQLSRAVEGRTEKRPTLSDLRSSGAIEQDADAVLFLYREDYYDSSKTTPTELIVAKQRLGEATGRKVLLNWKPIAGRYE
jgi:replicative DNA helicase